MYKFEGIVCVEKKYKSKRVRKILYSEGDFLLSAYFNSTNLHKKIKFWFLRNDFTVFFILLLLILVIENYIYNFHFTSQLVGILGVLLTLYLLYIARDAIKALKHKDEKDAFKIKRDKFINELSAHIHKLTNEHQPIDLKLDTEIKRTLDDLETYGLILGKKTLGKIQDARAYLEGKNRNKIIATISKIISDCKREDDSYHE